MWISLLLRHQFLIFFLHSCPWTKVVVKLIKLCWRRCHALLHYIKLIEVLIYLKMEILSTVQDAYVKLVVKGILYRKTNENILFLPPLLLQHGPPHRSHGSQGSHSYHPSQSVKQQQGQ